MADNQNIQIQNSQELNAVAMSVVAPIPPTPVQTDIAKIETAINDLVTSSETLFEDEIAILKQKRDALLEKMKSEVATAEQTFSKKYGQAAVHTVEIILLAAILGKLVGVI